MHDTPDITKHQAYAVAWGILLPTQGEGMRFWDRKAVREHCRNYARRNGWNLHIIDLVADGERWEMIKPGIRRVCGSLQQCMQVLVEEDQEPIPTS